MSSLLHHPMFGITISLIAYVAALRVHQRLRWLHPLFLCSGSLILFLVCFDIPYEAYKTGGDLLALFLGPATVALGVPLYKHRNFIRSRALPILSGVTAGSAAGILSAGMLVWILGGSRELMFSMMPKSTTSPIAIEISRQLGGIPELSAVFAVITGLLGSMFGLGLLRICGIRGDIPLGIAMGTAAHGIGTAGIIRESELQGSLSGLAMGLAGIVAAFLFIPLYIFFSR